MSSEPCRICNGRGGDYPADGGPWEDCKKCNGTGIDHHSGCVLPKQDQKTIYQRAVDLWGPDAQIKMAIEECGELIVKLAKLRRLSNGSSLEDIAEEIADVLIMMEQLKLIFGDVLVDAWTVKKLIRLEERIKYGEGTA